MLVTDIQTQARQFYNAVGDSFFPDAVVNNFIYHACNIFARNCRLIENIYSFNTVASTQSYSLTTNAANALAIKRVTVGGRKVKYITRREDDAVTLSNQNISTQGYPVYYYVFNNLLYFRPIPDAIYAVSLESYDGHGTVSNLTTLTIPTIFHMDIVDYILARMFSMDQNPDMAKLHFDLWDQHLIEARRWKQRMTRSDSFRTVQSEDTLPVTILGEV